MTDKANRKHSPAYDPARTRQFDLIDDVILSRGIAWKVATVSWLLTGLALIALIGLTPLKDRYALPILVDRNTGYARIMQTPDDLNGLHSDTMTNLDHHWIQEYIHARESFQPERLATYYQRVRLFSCPDEFKAYAWRFDKANKQSDYIVYKDRHVNVVIKSIQSAGTIVDKHDLRWRSYNVLMERELTPGNGAVRRNLRKISHEISLAVRFRQLVMEERRLRLNPLGFTVCYYERDQYIEPNSTRE